MFKTFALLAAVAGLSTPLLAADQAPSAPAKKEKKICREIEGVSTRMNKKVCKTAAEWQGNAAPKASTARPEGSTSKAQ